MRIKFLVQTMIIAALSHGAAQSKVSPNDVIELTVHADQSGPIISRDIFGQFAEMLGEGIYGGVWVGPESKIPNVRGIRSDVVAALRAIKVPNVRWPGGCFADDYDWRDGIGPKRVSHINLWGNVIEPNSFGSHEFMDFVEQIGSEAYISVNVGSGTTQQAANWLEYLTVDQPTTLGLERAANGRNAPWKVKFVGLGNENWGCGGGMTAETYTDRMKIFASFIKSYHPDQLTSPFKPNPNAVRKIAVGQGLGETEFTEAVMKAWKKRVSYGWNIDALSLHYYTGDPEPLVAASIGFGEKEYVRIIRNTLKMNDMLTEHEAIMDRYDPAKKIALSIDEWGVWLKPTGTNFSFLRQQNSLRDAIAAALNFNIFIRHADRVHMANIAQMVNVIQSVILTDGPNMVLTPTYYVHQMYVPFQDARVIPTTFKASEYKFGDISLPSIDAVAARGKDGKIWLALTNVDANISVDVNAALLGIAAKSATGNMLTAARVDSVNDFDRPPAVLPRNMRIPLAAGKLILHLPPKSLMVVKLNP